MLDYTPTTPLYLDRGVDARILNDNDVGVTFVGTSPARALTVEDRVVLSDITVVPPGALTTVAFRVSDLATPGGPALLDLR